MNFKKVLLPFAAGALALGLAACSEDEAANNEEAATEEQAGGEQQSAEEQQAAQEEMQAKLDEQKVADDEVVATVNGEEILGADYNNVLQRTQMQFQMQGQDPTSEEAANQMKEQALNLLIDQTILLQKADEAGLEASEEEIDEEYAAFAEQNGGEEQLTTSIEEQGMTVEELRGQMAESIKFEKYIDQVAPVEEPTDQEIQEYYDQATAQAEEAGQEAPALEDVRDTIVQSLQQSEQQELVTAHLEEIKADAEIETLI
ncbi:SurA N-terminal domain-containing protein [Jeotgalibacillus aurantiacus]|uniref:SurA N-terminal domain-containing protein n=1 Tax=Jeotgalibacillus aurantiacus TaxID=2763266 RepID=UPI001D09C2E4|nr:SurA N-terminal domain-containing protein [Jeotgalibacillus aurantiacus]